MKKIILSLLIVAASVSVASAQKVQWGVKAGFNASTYTISVENASPSINLGCKPGFYVGAVNNINFNDRNWSLQTELMYSLDGTRLAIGKDLVNEISDGFLNKNLAAAVSMHNVRLPIMVKFQPTGRLGVMAGPYVSYLVAAKINLNSNLENLLRETEIIAVSDIKKTGKQLIEDNMRRFDVGVALGVEYKFCNGVFIDVRYNMSLLNSLGKDVEFNGERATWKDLFQGYDIQPSLKYSALQIGVGYRF